MSMTINQYVDKFSQHVTSAINSIESAAKCYVEAIHAFPESAQVEFEKRYPHVTANTWSKFKAVGEGDLNPSAMLLSDKFCARIAKMPKVRQDEVLNGDSFEIFNPTTREVECVNYGQMKPRHERIVFDDKNTRIRTIPEQIAYCDLVDAAKRAVAKTYTVHTDHLEVHCACQIGKNELERIVEEME